MRTFSSTVVALALVVGWLSGGANAQDTPAQGAGGGGGTLAQTLGLGNTATGPIKLGGGSAGAPSFSFSADATSGMWQPSAGSLAFSTNGTEAARFDGSGNFRLANAAGIEWASSAARLYLGSDGWPPSRSALNITQPTDGTLVLANGSTNMTGTNTYKQVSIAAGGFNDAASGTAIGLGLVVEPTINWSVVSTGKYEAFVVNPHVTSAPTGANLLAAFRVSDVNKLTIAPNGATTITPTAGNVALTLTGGTVTGGSGVPPLSITGTWNNGTTTHRGIEAAFTDTASASGSTLMRLLAGGAGATEVLSVTKSGQMTLTPTGAGSFLYVRRAGVAGSALFAEMYTENSVNVGTMLTADESAAAVGQGGGLALAGTADGGGGATFFATIRGYKEAATSDRAASLLFSTRASGGSNPTAQWAISSTGVLAGRSGVVVGWTSSSTDPTGVVAPDAGISRNGGASDIAFGDGTAGSKAATLNYTTGKLEGKVTRYNATTTAGYGHTTVFAASRATGQTAANASVSTFTVGASDGSFVVSANVLITTLGSGNFTVTVAYTDESSSSRTTTLNFSNTAGTIGTACAAAAPFQGVPLHIRCKASTAITIATTGTFTGCTYNVEGIVRQES